jgi:predicted O-methyltransferase YrrM
MKLNEFLKELPSIMMSDNDDARFEALRLICRGMASARLGKIIHYACKHLDNKTETYVEQGTWTGFTLASAGLDSNNSVIGIDPYDLEYGNEKLNEHGKKLMEQNMRTFETPAFVLQSDFRKIVWDDPKTIGVLFIDADHTYQDVIDGLVWAEPHLSKEAIIIFDDFTTKGKEDNAKEVSEAITDWLKEHSKYRLEACIRGVKPDRYVGNGFAIISYKNI